MNSIAFRILVVLCCLFPTSVATFAGSFGSSNRSGTDGTSGAAGTSGASSTEDRTPIPIDNPPPMLPIETIGSGIAPEVSVRVSIDDRGAVESVEVRSIRPSSEFDERIAQAVRDQLSEWRYAPQIKNGKAISADLEWTVLLVPRTAPPPKRTVRNSPAAFNTFEPEVRPSEAAEVWETIQAMSEQQRVKALDESVTLAKKYLVGEPRRVASRAFVVWTDKASEELATVLAQNLDATLLALIEMFDGVIELQKPKYKLVAFVYSTQDAFDGMRREVLNVESVSGFYNPVGLLGFHRQMPSDQAVLSVLLHEGTHAFVDRFLVRRGVVLPRWLGEGFASYIGNSRIQKGALVPGRVPQVDYYLTPDATYLEKSMQILNVNNAKQALKKGTALELAELVNSGPDQFYGERISEFYTMAWLLVHYLREGADDWAEDRFPLFMLYVGEGYPAEDAFRAAYDRSLEEMETGFVEYLRKF